MRLKIALMTMCCIFSFMTAGLADIVKKGQVGFRFLENPIGADAIGRGGLGVVGLRNSNAVFWNPAGVAWIQNRFDVCQNYTKGIADINHGSLVGAMALHGIGVIALDVLVMDYGDFYGTRRADNEVGYEETGTFTPISYAVGLTFSQRVSDRFSYGVHIKYAHQDLGSTWIGTAGTDVNDPNLVMTKKSYVHSEPAVDVGAIYDFLNHGLRFGAVIQNFSREIKYEEEKFPLPFAVSFSLMIDPLSFLPAINKQHSLKIGFESRHPRDFKEKIKLGAEYSFLQDYFARIGYMGNYDERGMTFGLGVQQAWTHFNFRLDYAFQDFGLFSSVHTFTFGVGF